MNQTAGVQNELWREDGSKTSSYVVLSCVSLFIQQLSTKCASVHVRAGGLTRKLCKWEFTEANANSTVPALSREGGTSVKRFTASDCLRLMPLKIKSSTTP